MHDASVSDERLNEVVRWSSKSGFNKDSADVPVSLFQEVRHSVEKYEEYSLIITDMNKGGFVIPEMSQRASNEDEWFDWTMKSHVAGSVMTETLNTLGPQIVDVDSPLVYWQQIKIAASKIRKKGGTPILFVGGQAEPHWLLEWASSSFYEGVPRPGGPRLVHEKCFEDNGYVGSLNDVPVFVGPIGPGSSYLIQEESLDALTFTEFEDGVYVQVSFEPVEGKDTLINLRLSWRFQLDLKMRECWQLRYIQSQEPMKAV